MRVSGKQGLEPLNSWAYVNLPSLYIVCLGYFDMVMKGCILETNFPFGKMVVQEARVVTMTQGDKVLYKVGVTKQMPWLAQTG